MFERLEEVERRFEELTALLSDPDVGRDPRRLAEVARERARLQRTVDKWRAYRQAQEALESARQMLAEDDDPEIRQLAREEVAEAEARLVTLRDELLGLLLPEDPLDARNVILEIRAGTGGEEAALFAGDIYRMYERYAASKKWKIEVLSASPGAVGGFKEVIALVSGQRVYSQLKFEAGVHRVQRVPVTESQGRIHTSAVTVAVLPEAEDIDVQIDERDLRIDVFRASGRGGQHVNTTDSAVRITHLPTGLTVSCQDERSQHKNRARAMRILRARLLEREREAQHRDRAAQRRSMVGTGDRSERIRTYNFPQNRVTDHRINLTLYSLDRIMEGEGLQEVIDALIAHYRAEELKRIGAAD